MQPKTLPSSRYEKVVRLKYETVLPIARHEELQIQQLTNHYSTTPVYEDCDFIRCHECECLCTVKFKFTHPITMPWSSSFHSEFFVIHNDHHICWYYHDGYATNRTASLCSRCFYHTKFHHDGTFIYE